MEDGAIIQTQIRFSTDLLDRVSGFSFLTHSPSGATPIGLRNDEFQYPFVFLCVTGMSEKVVSKTSNKKLIIFDERSNIPIDDNSGVITTVSDNIVVSPKTYSISGLIPKGLGSSILNPFVSMMNAASFVSGKEVSNGVQTAALAYESVRRSLDILGRVAITEGNDSPTKYAIESYQKNRNILYFKPPLSWNLKSVFITDSSFSAITNNKEFLEFTIELQDINILSINTVEPVGATRVKSELYIDSIKR